MYSSKAYGLFELGAPLAFCLLRPNVFPLAEEVAGVGTTVEDLAVTVPKIRAKVVGTHASEGQRVEIERSLHHRIWWQRN